jgi:hypothetical protein
MIKLSLTRKELSHFSSFFQQCINIARNEIHKQADVQVYMVDRKNYSVKEVSWPTGNSDKTAIRIAERHANISEFESAQEIMIRSYMRKSKAKTVSLSPTQGFLILCYMGRAEALQKDEQINLTIQIHSQTILQKLI